jgi:hypothetical protein
MMHRQEGSIQVEAHADGPIASLEWIVNGKIERISVDGQIRKPDGSWSIRVERSSGFDTTAWVAVRVWQEPSPGRWRFAHTAPIWFDVPGKPLRPTLEEKQFLIDRVQNELDRSRGVLSPEGVAEYQESLDRYRKLDTGR